MYSEEEVYELLCQFFDDHVNAQDANIAKWFEKNKKK
jgi:hemerythrin